MSNLYKNNRKAEDLGFSVFILNYENNSFDRISDEVSIKKLLS